jgi:integrase/recombinase XerD
MPSQQTRDACHWLLDHRRVLTQSQLRRLTRSCITHKDNARFTSSAAPVRDWFIVKLASETGLRLMEIQALNCGDLITSGDSKAVLVRHGKGDKKRLVRISSSLARCIDEFLAWKVDQEEPVQANDPLLSIKGRRLSKRAIQKSFRRSMDRAGISQPRGVGIHSLRHTYATYLLKASNNNLRLVQQQLGHASIRTTEVYTHVFDSDVKKAVEKLYT